MLKENKRRENEWIQKFNDGGSRQCDFRLH